MGGLSREPAAVRRAGPEDAPRIWDLIRELARYERLEDRLSGDPGCLARDLSGEAPIIRGLIAERDGAPVGYAIFFTTYSSFRTAPMMWLEDIYVKPGERGAGTGRALFEAVAREAVARGCWRLSWEVLEWNELAIRFYERLGARRDPGGWFTYHLREGLETVARGG